MQQDVVGPAEVGLDPGRLELVRTRLDEWIAQGDVHRTMVALVARHGKVAFREAFGVDGPEPDAQPLRTDAIFPMASQSKSMTATLIMLLAEDGLLGLSRPVQDYLPEFVGERKDQILVHHLLTHTSGIDDRDFFPASGRLLRQMVGSIGNAFGGQHPMEHLFLELAYVWPAAHPADEVSRYANVNFFLLGEIVRRVSGRSLDDLAQGRLFGPLGMTDTTFCAPPADRAHRIVRRSFDEDPAPEYIHSESGRGASGGAGGAYATAVDLASFVQLFLNDGVAPDGRSILHPSSIQRMTTNQIPGVPGELFDRVIAEASFVLGWIDTDSRPKYAWPMAPAGSFQHGGASLIWAWADPATEVVGVLCTVADRMRTVGGTPVE
ncbi:MAG: serine hydrolase domain-containing protein, partial [Acidimicrobiales bacterium]